jgi:hypothetical protein
LAAGGGSGLNLGKLGSGADAMADKKRDQPKTEKTPKAGITVPIPKRAEFFRNLKKVGGKDRGQADPENSKR